MREDEKFKMEIPLNSVFIYGDSYHANNRVTIKCVEDVKGGVCDDCVFNGDPYCEVFDCIREFRSDGKDVFFIEVKEVL